MYSLVFGLFSLAFLLFYGSLHTFFFVKKIKQETEYKKYTKYASILGLYGFISFTLAIILYFYGVG